MHTRLHQPALPAAASGSRRRRRTVLGAVGTCVLAVAATAAPPALGAATAPDGRAMLSAALASGEVLGVAAVSADDVWIGGSTTDDPTATYLAHYDGTHWRRVDSPNPSGSTGSHLTNVAASSAHNVWAAGYYDDSTGGAHTLALHKGKGHWKISQTADVEGSSASSLQSVAALSKRDVWAVGNSIDQSGAYHALVERWDGHTWSLSPAPDPEGAVNTILAGVTGTSASDVWVTGTWLDASFVGHSLVEHWDGSSWTVVPTPDPDGAVFTMLYSADALAGDDVWTGGYYADSAGHQYALVERWDGSSWTIQPITNPPGTVATGAGIEALSDDDVWLVGDFLNARFETVAEHWDGTTWTLSRTPNRREQSNYLWGVSAVASDDVWAAGYSLQADGTAGVLHLHWNGRSWHRK